MQCDNFNHQMCKFLAVYKLQYCSAMFPFAILSMTITAYSANQVESVTMIYIMIIYI